MPTKFMVALLLWKQLRRFTFLFTTHSKDAHLSASASFIVSPAGDNHGAQESNIVVELKIQGERRGHGKVRCGDVGIILRRNPDCLVGADALFVANDRLPIRTSPEGYLETIPNLVVEVRSKNDRPTDVAEKVNEYLVAGVHLVWVLDAKTQTVTAYRPGQPTRVFDSNATLTADEVIPEFSVSVAELFRS
jgi:Uma2 family endonuclease